MSVFSLRGSPRCALIFIINVRAPLRTRALTHSMTAIMISAFASLASVVRGPLPIHRDILLRAASLSHDCGAEDCITRVRRLWRAQLVGRPRRRPTRRCASPAPLSAQTVAGWSVWVDILLDVIGGGSSALREGCPRTMTGVSQYWFSGHFRQVFSTPMHYPALTLAPTCGANRAS